MNANNRILVAEFESIDAAYLCGLLERNGWSAEIAGDGSEVIHKLQQEDYSLVLINSNQAKVIGFETTRKIKDLEGEMGKRIPVVGVTSHTIEAEKKNLMKAGADYCITKPVYKNVLFETFKNIFNQQVVSTAS